MTADLRKYVHKSVQLNEQISTLQRRGARYESGRERSWQPLFDIYHHRDDMFIDVELPGVPPEMVEVETGKGIVVVRGTKPSFNDEPQREDILSARQFGEFTCRFATPADRAVSGLERRMENGVLHLKVRLHLPQHALPEGR